MAKKEHPLDKENLEKINHVLGLLERNGFRRKSDKVGGHHKDGELYYVEVSFEKYKELSLLSIYKDESAYTSSGKRYFVVLSEFCGGSKTSQRGFDLWLSVYDTASVGNKKPLHTLCIQLSCQYWMNTTNSFFEVLEGNEVLN